MRATSLASSADRPRQAAEELGAIVDAIEARDARAAQRGTLRHVQNAAKAGIKALENAGEFTPEFA